MANEIRIPIKLEVLQNSIGDLQKILSSLQPNTAGFKAIQRIINQMTNEAQKLQVQLSKPFNSEGQFRSTNKTIDKLEESAGRISVIMDGLKFSDLKLTPDQQASFDQLNNEINNIKNNYQQLLNEVKTSVLSNANNASLVQNLFGSKTLTADFEQIRAEVDNHISEIERQKIELQNKYNELARSSELAGRAKILTSTTGGITKQSIGQELFDKYLWQNGSEIGFKVLPSQSKETFLRELEEMFNLDSGQLQELAGKTFKQLNEAFQQMGQQGNLNPFQSLISAFGKDKTQAQLGLDKNKLKELETEINEYKRLQGELNNLQQQKVNPADVDAQGKISVLTNELSKLENQILKTAGVGGSLQQPLSQIGSQAQYLRTSLEQCNVQFLKMQRTTQQFNQMKMAIVNFMGFSQVLNLTKRAVKEAMNHIKELDTVMNKISIVTDMSTGDLWNQVDAYSKMAQSYGVSIKGAYEVSQIYYQQGLETKDVLTLTNETLKLAKISGLDYATTTDYMTTALRGFKMEMSEASTVVDVYSNLAAHTAVSSEELAVAMSKTASSMESVGSTFEESSAMIATMVAVTRESATNIGSALKSIAARYGEMKSNPEALVDSEGELMAYNKVDAALQSVGISLKTADGQFREFTDVIIELGEQWNQLDSVQQRYIATQFAGNRQQSRFLALVSNVDLLKSNLNYAENAEDTGTLQALKALDSIESKTEQVRVAYQQFYTTIGAQDVWKGFLDGAKNVINTLNGLPKLFDTIPIGAITIIYDIISIIKTAAITGISSIAGIITENVTNTLNEGSSQAKEQGSNFITQFINGIKGGIGGVVSAAKEASQAATSAMTQEQKNTLNQASTRFDTIASSAMNIANDPNANHAMEVAAQTSLSTFAEYLRSINVPVPALTGSIEEMVNVIRGQLNTSLEEAKGNFDAAGEGAVGFKEKTKAALTGIKEFASKSTNLSSQLGGFASALNMVGSLFNTTTTGGRYAAGALMSLSGAFRAAGAAAEYLNKGFTANFYIMSAMAIVSVINGISTAYETASEKLERLTKEAEELGNKAKEVKAEYRTLDNSIKKINELEQKRYDSAEAAEEYQTAVDDLTSKFPILISSFDEAGNAIISAAGMEATLETARRKAAEATLAAVQAENLKNKQELENKKGEVSSAIGNVNALLTTTKKDSQYTSGRTLATYQKEDGSWGKIGAYGGGSQSLYTKLLENEDNLTQTQQKLLTWMQSEKGYTSDGMALTALLTQSADAAKHGEYKTAASLNDILNIAYKTMDWTMPKEVENAVSTLNTKMSEITPILDSINAVNKETVNAWIRSSDYYDLPFIQNNSKIFGTVEDKIYKDAQGDFSTSNLELIGESTLKQADIFWNSLSTNTKDTLNTMFEHPEKYTPTDIQNFLKDKNITSMPDYLLDLFTENTKKIKENVSNKINQIFKDNTKDNKDYEQFLSFINDENLELTLSEQKFLNTILDQVASLNTQGIDSTDITTASINIIDKVKTVAPELREALLNQILVNGFTKEGLQKTLDYIASNDKLAEFDTSDLETIMNNIIPNINLSSQTVLSDFKENWEDINKLFSSLYKGIEQKDIESTIQKAQGYGIELREEDFLASGDNFIIDTTAINTYLNDLYNHYTTAFGGMKTSLETAYKDLGTPLEDWEDGSISFAATDIKNYQTILGAEFKDWFSYDKEQNIHSLQEGKTLDDLQIAVDETYENGIATVNNLYSFFDNIIINLKKSSAWSAGDYSSLLETSAFSSLKDQTPATAFQMLTQRLYQLADINYDDWSIEEKNEPDVKKAVKNIRSAYSSLISDVLDKGFDNIDLSDYDGLIGIDKNSLTGSYKDFIKNYASRTGQTTQEINELYLSASNKDSLIKSENLIKDVTFINSNQAFATESTLGELADTFNQSIIELLDSGAVVFNEALQEYSVDVQKLKDFGIDLTGVDNFKTVVEESIEALFSSISSDISNALKGSLDIKGRTNLINNLSRFNIQLTENDFSKTTDGLRLAESTAISLYNQLKAIDAIQARVTFNAISDNLKENSEHYSSVSAILNRIVELENLIVSADSKTSSARIQQYEEELALAKEILATRSVGEDDSFNFMSNKIPGGQNNPLNYYKNWAQAIQSLQTAMKTSSTNSTGKHTGLIGYEDWYNIVTELNNAAALMDEPLEIGKDINGKAITLNGDLQSAADLIEKGAAALTTTDTGDIKVALGDIGIDFAAGSGAFSQSIDKGIKEVAQQQVAMLDSVISMLETIVAMEQLGDFDTNADNTIDLGEMGLKIEGEEIIVADAEQFDNVADKFNKIVKSMGEDADSININGHSLSEIAEKIAATDGDTDALNTALTELNLSLQDVNSIISTIYELSKDPDWDTKSMTNITQMIQDAFSGKNLKLETTVNPYKSLKINYDDKGVQDRIKEVFNNSDKAEQQFKALLKEAQKKPKEVKLEDIYKINYVAGKITVTKDSNGKDVYNYKGKKYTSQDDVARAIQLEDQYGAKGVKQKKWKRKGKNNKEYTVEGEEGTLTFRGTKYHIRQDRNGKITYEYGGKEYKTQGEALQAITLKSLKNEVKGTRSKEQVSKKFGKNTITGTETTIKMNNGEVKILVDNTNGQIWYEGPNGKVYSNFDDMIDAEIKASRKGKDKNRKTVTNEEREKYKIEQGYTIVPKLEEISQDKLTARNLKNLQGKTIEDLKTEWKDDQVDFEYKYGFSLEGANEGDIEAFLKQINELEEEQSSTTHLKVDVDAGEDEETVKKILSGDDITINATIEASAGETVETTIDQINASFTGTPNTDNIKLNAIEYPELDAFITLVNGYYTKKPNQKNIKLKAIDYDNLTAWITTVEGYFTDQPDQTNIKLLGIDYEALDATIKKIKAKYNGSLTEENINLPDISYGEQIAVGLINILLKTNEGTDFDDDGIQIGDDEVKISDLINALLTGTIKLNGDGVTAEAGNITLANGNEIPLPKETNVIGLVNELILRWTNGTTPNPTMTELPYKTEYELEPGTATQVVTKKYVVVDPGLPDISNSGINGAYESWQYERKNSPNPDIWEEHPTVAQVLEHAGTSNAESKGVDYSQAEAEVSNYLKTCQELPEELKMQIEAEDNASNVIDICWDYLQELPAETLIKILGNNSDAEEKLQELNEDITKPEEKVIDINTDGANSKIEELNEELTSPVTKPVTVEETSGDNKPVNTKLKGYIASSGVAGGYNFNTPIQNTSDAANTAVQQMNTIVQAADNVDASKTSELAQESGQVNSKGVEAAATAINSIKSGPAESARDALNNIHIQGQTVDATANINVQITHNSVSGSVNATGNMAMAGGTRTLMGELGPELVVSNGRYFLAGQSGAEFVDLDKDAIVFNHKQTERLFAQGGIGSRGKPFTNEKNAISFAKGSPLSGLAHAFTNMPDGEGVGPGGGDEGEKELPWKTGWSYTYTIRAESGGVSGHLWGAPVASITVPSAAKGNVKESGPAKASASAALAALKQLRAQWQALAGLSVQDLAGKGGGGGGGGGGGDPKAFIKDLERWYNWLQKIAQLEKEINQEEAKRNKYQSSFTRDGGKYFDSQKATLDYLQEQLKTQMSLNKSQEAYFNERRKQLNTKGAFKALYTFDENGQLKYKSGALSWLSKLSGRDERTGKANYTAKQQYQMLVKKGYGFAMKYDSSGNKIKHEGNDWYSTAVQAFWDKVEAEREEMQTLHDDIEDGKQKVTDLITSQNEILQDIEDNYIAVENKVLKAVEDSRTKQIDELKDQRDAIEEASNKLIDGLSKNLQKEQDMYNQQDQTDELQKLQRQLAIMQRSGGSAAQIADLQQQIADKQQDMYFDIQQKQIDALQEASDNQLERLDHQIELMEQSLDYEKENGLLWNKVSEILQGTSESIAAYIAENTEEYKGKSATDLGKTTREDYFQIDQLKEYQKSGLDIYDTSAYGEEAANAQIAKEEAAEKKEAASTKETSSSKNEKSSTKKTTTKKTTTTKWGIKKVGNEYKAVQMKNGIYATESAAKTAAQKIKDGKATLSGAHAVDKTTGKTAASTQQKIPGKTFESNGKIYRYNKDGTWTFVRKAASGGYVNHGLYELGELGTETVLTAQQTQVLRDNILSNRPDSLISLLKSYNQAYHGLSAATYDSIATDNSNSVTIERAEVNLQIEKLANDYDSKRAANTVMEEMLRIASKTSANNSVRR